MQGVGVPDGGANHQLNGKGVSSDGSQTRRVVRAGEL